MEHRRTLAQDIHRKTKECLYTLFKDKYRLNEWFIAYKLTEYALPYIERAELISEDHSRDVVEWAAVVLFLNSIRTIPYGKIFYSERPPNPPQDKPHPTENDKLKLISCIRDRIVTTRVNRVLENLRGK